MSTTIPPSLRPLQREGYGYTVTPATTSTARDRSTVRCRRLGTEPRMVADLSWIFTDAEMAVFSQWWHGDLQEGSLQATVTMRNGLGDAAMAVQFLGVNKVDDLQGRWRVSNQVWVPSPPRLGSLA